MKNYTVKALIEELKKLDQDAVVCTIIAKDEDDAVQYSAVQDFGDRKSQFYYSNNGTTEEGKIVYIY